MLYTVRGVVVSYVLRLGFGLGLVCGNPSGCPKLTAALSLKRLTLRNYWPVYLFVRV